MSADECQGYEGMEEVADELIGKCDEICEELESKAGRSGGADTTKNNARSKGNLGNDVEGMASSWVFA